MRTETLLISLVKNGDFYLPPLSTFKLQISAESCVYSKVRPVKHVSEIDMAHYLVSNRGRVYFIRTRTFLS